MAEQNSKQRKAISDEIKANNEFNLKLQQQEASVQRDLVKLLSDQAKLTQDQQSRQADILASVSGQQDIEAKLRTIAEEKAKILEEQAKTGEKIDQQLLDQLDNAELALKVAKERKDIVIKRKDLQEELNKGLKEALGYNSEIADLFMAGGIMAVGAKAFTDGIEAAGAAFSATYDTAKDLYKTTGLTANESAQLAANAQFAAMSFNPFGISAEEAASATTALVDRLGSAQLVSSALIQDAAEIGNLTGDAASGADLALIFEQASGDAGALADDIKDIASKSGVAANKVFAQLADQQAMLLNMSEEEIKVLAEKTAELTKQGLSMDKLRGVADSMLDIEGSISAQMKARAFGLGDMLPDQQAMRDAALEMQYGDATKGAEMMAAALKESGMNAEEFGKMGFKQQEMYAQAIGMSRDELQQQLITQQKNEEMVGKYGKTGAEVMGFISAGAASAASGAKELAIQFVKIAAQGMIMNKIMTGNSGFGNLFGGGGGKGPDMSKMTGPVNDATSNVKTPDPKKSKGIKGFLKGLKSGLQSFAKGAGKTLLGAAVLAGVVTILGAGFTAAMLMLGDVDPVAMLAFSVSMGILGATLALMGSISGNVLMGAAALAIVAVALIPAAYAFSLLENVDVAKMITFSIMLPLLGLAAAGLGFIAPLVLAGAAALMILGLALIPAGMAFGMLEGLNTDTIVSFAIGVGILATTVAGLGFLSPFIMLGSVAITALGLALIPAATAFGMLADANMEGIVDKLSTLGQVAGPLLTVGAGLMSIAAGLGMMGMAGMVALPVLGMMLALSAAAPALLALGSMFGLGGGGDEGGDDPVVAELQGLRSDIQSQPIQIVVDNKVISEITRVQSVRQSRRV